MDISNLIHPKVTNPRRQTSHLSDNSRMRGGDESTSSEPTRGIKRKAKPSPQQQRIGKFYVCSCCLKKPKKFETEQQLKSVVRHRHTFILTRSREHENEKQFKCAYCNNRFKNKNEAERHQNSVHLRTRSWSCATMSAYNAFQPSDPQNLATITCGFCGEEFLKCSLTWHKRIDHLTNVHKFGECNLEKKFYRADHFRQHLQHSHAGTSKKWMKALIGTSQREESN